MTRRTVLVASTALLAGGAAAPVLAAGPAAAATPALTLLRNANSGDPAGAGTARWPLQVIQGDLPRPPRSVVPEQLVYASAFLRRSDPSGVTQCVLPRNVPASWLLTDAAGAVITRNGGDDAAIDVGNPAFQKAAADYLVAKCRAGSTWTGVHHDEVNAHFDWGWPGRTPVKYPTPVRWQAALRAHLSYLATRLRAAGFSLVSNLGSAQAGVDDWYTALVLAGVVPSIEYFVCGEKASSGPTAFLDTPDWERHLEYIEAAQSNRDGSPTPALGSGVRIIVHERQDTEPLIRYSLASYLLATAGDGSSAYGADVDYSAFNTPYPPSYTAAAQLGAPTGGRVQLGDTLWGRYFQHGWVLANNGAGGAAYAGYSLDPHSGLITVTG